MRQRERLLVATGFRLVYEGVPGPWLRDDTLEVSFGPVLVKGKFKRRIHWGQTLVRALMRRREILRARKIAEVRCMLEEAGLGLLPPLKPRNAGLSGCP